MTLLLTGFEPYGGRGINPAHEVVGTLDGTEIAGHAVVGRTIPVAYEGLADRIRALVAETAPVVVIGLGLWPGEPVIRLERVAVNLADFEIADNAGRIAAEPLDPGGPAAFAATIPVARIRDRLLAAGIPARLSGTAGQFLCNALLYRALQACAASDPAPSCGFVHVPYLPEQVAALIRDVREEARLELHQRADLASIDKALMVEAIRLAFLTTLETAPA
jgi:pyroglutamyl-peptidase